VRKPVHAFENSLEQAPRKTRDRAYNTEPSMFTQPATSTRRLPLVIAALAAVVVAMPMAASAMTIIQAPLSELVKTSEYVLHGRIAKVEVLDMRRQGRGVWTEFTLNVTDALKGDARKIGKQFKWRLVGGTTKDGMTMSVPGMPTFHAGEETVILLERHSTGHTLTGAPQGKFHVTTDAKGRKFVSRDMRGAHVVRKDPKTGRLVSVQGHGHHGARTAIPGKPVAHVTKQPLAELRKEIRGYVAAQARAARKAPAGKAMPRTVHKRR